MSMIAFPTRTAVIALLLISPLFLTACSDNTVGADEPSLDQSTSMEIFSELSAQIMGIAFGSFKSDGSLSLPTMTAEDIPVSVTADCTSGGTVSVNGVISSTGSGDTGTVGFDLRQKPSECGIETSMGTFVVDGDPDLRIRANMELRDGEPVGAFEFGYDGGFGWNGPDGVGSCRVDLTYSINPQTGQLAMRGSMCGHNMDHTV